jgi:pimeloyl-ACP methyl ester carboxylesterase
MGIAMTYPDRVEGLIVMDSAPIDYWDNPLVYELIQDVINKIHKIDMKNKKRADISKILRELFSSNVANLILTNITNHDESDFVKWRINIDVLFKDFRKIIDFEMDGKYSGETRIILGELSYAYSKDVYSPFFPKLEDTDIKTIKGAGNINLKKRTLGTF